MLIWQMWNIYGLISAAFDLFLHISAKYIRHSTNQTYEHVLVEAVDVVLEAYG